MAKDRVELSERIQQRIAECEADVRGMLYGAAAPLDDFWSRRAAKFTGFRAYQRSKT